MPAESAAGQLDVLVHQICEKLQELSSLRRQLDKELSDGFLYMAKARSNMGQKSITALQYDEREMTPSVTLTCKSEDNSVTFDLAPSAPLLQAEEKVETVRKRFTEQTIQTVGGVGDPVPSPKADKPKSEIKDPLLMFGVLVPQSLRSSKGCFQRCVPLTSQLSTTQSQLMSLQCQYRTLLSQLDQ